MKTRMTRSQGNGLVILGVAILVVGVGLSLYAVPSSDPRLPSFPFLESRAPIVPLLVVLGTMLPVLGAVMPRGRRAFFAAGVISVVVILTGLLLWALSLATALPVNVGAATLYVEPYGAQALLAVGIGVLLGLFDLLAFGILRTTQGSKAPA